MAANVFGVLVSGRLLQTNFAQASEREFMTEIADADAINHVVVFLTGVQPFPTDLGGAVYMRWPLQNGSESNWHYLGYICNEKPSAIFKVSQLRQTDALHSSVFGSSFSAAAHGTAQLGIQVGPIWDLKSLAPASTTQASNQSTLIEFADKMVGNLLNYAQSFTVRLPKPDDLGSADFVPLSAILDWSSTFSRRFQQNPNFWRALN